MDKDIKFQKIAFEYNEENGTFHENVGDHKENTHGYKTVCHTTYAELDCFNIVRHVVFPYSLGRNGNVFPKGKPTFEDVQSLWQAWHNSALKHEVNRDEYERRGKCNDSL